MPSDQRRILSLLRAALDVPPEQRDEFLDRECGDDSHLRAEIESLLDADVAAGSFLETPALEQAASVSAFAASDVSPGTDTGVELVGSRVGKYQIRGVIGVGGMAVVYEAVQENPHRIVALKVMRRGIASRDSLRRFQHESEVLAHLRHPSIAQVYEAGVHHDGVAGVPFFAMEHVPGARTIRDYVDCASLGTRETLELFARVCDAVHHGHQKGVIHRDLKPANILVDEEGQAKVIDFGVARATDSDLAVTTQHTDVGQLIGTIPYMSPEQCAADPHDLDIRSDVYSLGVILYELLCGRLPYDVSSSSIYQATRVIMEDPPRRLSTIDQRLRGDVEAIVLRALEKDREKRYHSAAELADDLRRYLRDEPIVARVPTTWYYLRKFVSRNRWKVTAVSAVGVLLIATLVIALIATFALEARQARREAERARGHAEQRAYGANNNAALDAIKAYDSAGAADLLERAPEQLRGWEWHHLRDRVDLSIACITRGASVEAVAWSPRRDVVVIATNGGEVSVYDATDPLNPIPVRALDLQAERVHSLAFSENGTRLAVGFSPEGARAVGDECIAIFGADDPSDPVHLLTIGHLMDWVLALAFDSSGRYLASGTRNENGVPGELRLWDVEASIQRQAGIGTVLLSSPDFRVCSVALDPKGTMLAAGLSDATVCLWGMKGGGTGTPRSLGALRGDTDRVMSVAFTPDGRVLASGSLDGTIRLWDVQRIKTPSMNEGDDLLDAEFMTVDAHGAVCTLAFNKDATRLASGSLEGMTLWEVLSGGTESEGRIHQIREIAALRGHENWVYAVSFNAEGSLIASGSADGTARLWPGWRLDEVPTLVGHTSSIPDIVFDASGAHVLSAGADGTVRVWDPVECVELERLDEATSVNAVALDPRGLLIATATSDGQVHLWDAATLSAIRAIPGTIRHPPDVTALAFKPDGTLLVSGSTDGTIRTWSVVGPSMVADNIVSHGSQIIDLAFSDDGQYLASGAMDGSVNVWLVSSGNELQEIQCLSGHSDAVTDVEFHPTNAVLASASRDQTIRLWDVSTGEYLSTLSGHTGWVLRLAFHPDGHRLASGSEDHTIRVWDVETGEAVATLRAHVGGVSALAFSPDGTRLASGGSGRFGVDNSIKLWEAIGDGIKKIRLTRNARTLQEK